MSQTTEQIKERLSIVDIVGGYVTLQKAGVNFKARCPFHTEKTPSFMVSPVRNTYYCFGCGAKGDIFSFMQEFEGLDFPGALRVLAERAGVPIVHERGGERKENERLYEAMARATSFFEAELKKPAQKKARDYLKGRGLTPETVAAFRLGYAPASWSALAEQLRGEEFSERELERAGLVKKGDRGFYDRFRGRIMFPIFDSAGRVVAFSGRIFDESAAGGGEAAKYLNSPETPIFHKSDVLFGYDRAKLSIRRANFSIAVEGQMDLVLSHQAGFKNTVAFSGTALSDGHLRKLSRLSHNIVFALDADDAGLRAVAKAADSALALGMDVKIAALPTGRDPADLIEREGADAWKGIVRSSEHIIDFFLDRIGERGYDERTYRLEVARQVIPFLSRIPNAIDREHFLRRIADRLRLSPEGVAAELARVSTPSEMPREAGSAAPTKRAEEAPRSRAAGLSRALSGILTWQEALEDALIDLETLRKRLAALGIPAGARDEALAFEMEDLYGERENLQGLVDDMADALEGEQLKEEFAAATEALREAEAEGDPEAIEEAHKRSYELTKKLSAFSKRG